MRRSPLFYALLLTSSSLVVAEGACSSDDSGGVHGATFGDDSGSTPDGGHVLDGSPVEGDGASSDDGSIGTDGSTPTDGSTGSCTTGTVAVVGGGSTASFGAIATGNAALTGAAIATSAGALPSVVPFGGGFQAVFADATGALKASGSTGTTFSAPTAIGGVAREQPSVASEPGSLVLAFLDYGDGGSHDYAYSTFTTSWATPAAIPNAFGAHAPGAAGSGTSAVEGQVGSNGHIYVQSYTTSWQTSADIMSDAANFGSTDATFGTAPRLNALGGGTNDMMLLYTRTGDYKLMSITRTTGGAWATTPTLANTNAYTTEPFNLAGLAGGKAVVAWRGGDTHGYASVFDGTNWSAPITVANFAIASAPSVAPGNCTSVFVAAYAKTAGTVEVVRYDGASIGAPQAISGATGVKYVGIAVSP